MCVSVVLGNMYSHKFSRVKNNKLRVDYSPFTSPAVYDDDGNTDCLPDVVTKYYSKAVVDNFAPIMDQEFWYGGQGLSRMLW